MIWKLFKKKEIFVLTIPHLIMNEELDIVKQKLKDELGDQYKVVVIMDPHKVHMETKILK